jgi:cobalt/nickel transport system permease protein
MQIIDERDFSSDIYSQKANLLTAIDARVKIAFIISALILNLVSGHILTSIAIAVFCLITLLWFHIPLRLLLLRLILPIGMAIMILLTQMLLIGNTPLVSLSMASLHINLYREGLEHGLLILSRVIAGILLILFLSLSTPVHKLLSAFRWLKVPNVLIELGLLIYRYIFVLLDEAIIMIAAQKTRLGYNNWKRSINSLFTLSALLILRSYDRAERIYQAMLVRGYDSENHLTLNERLINADYFAAGIFIAILFSLYFIGFIA